MKKILFTLLASLAITSYCKAQPWTGSGTSGDPYMITNQADLDSIRNYLSSTYFYEQTQNITLTGSWTPLGSNGSRFNGNYNGSDYTIDGLTMNSGSLDEVGLFGVTSINAVVRNLGVINVNISEFDFVGGLVGVNYGIISNCYTTGLVEGVWEIGGLVGENNGTITDSYSSATSKGENQVGGLIGRNQSSVSRSYATGAIDGLFTSGVLGGFVGFNTSSINMCYATGDVESKETRLTGGGFVGENYGSINNCYSSGSVLFSEVSTHRNNSGGFAGNNGNYISNSYSIGLVKGRTIGGFAAINADDIVDSFWDTQTSGTSSSAGGTGKTTTQMKTKTTFTDANWDFIETWAIQPSENSGYPFPPDWYIWQGGSTGWSTGTNWSKGTVPTDNDYISITSKTNDPTISSSLTINYMVVADGAELTITSGNTLSIKSNGILTISPNGKITSEGSISHSEGVAGLIIESDDTGTGSIIVNNTGVQATVQRYITGTQQFHLISTPVSGQSIQNFLSENQGVIAQSGSNYAMRQYKADGTGWDSWFTSTQGGNVDPGTTYSVGLPTTGTLVFKGNLVSAKIDKSLTDAGFAWNGIGNPFPSGLNAKDGTSSFLSNYGDQLNSSYYGLYVWDPDLGQYQVINNVPDLDQNYLALAQGFMVKSKDEGGSVSFETAMRAHQNPTFYKNEGASDDWYNLLLRVENQDAKQLTTSLVFNHEMTTGFDVGYDAGFFSDNQDFRFFTRMPNDKNDLDILLQALPDDWNQEIAIPIGLLHTNGGEVEFSITSMTLPDTILVTLEDRELNTYTDLKGETYSVSISEESEPLGRFFLYVGSEPVSFDALIFTDDDLAYCMGEGVNVEFLATPNGGEYQWYKDDILIEDATSQSYVANEVGNYFAKVTIDGYTKESNVEEIIEYELPTVDIPEDFAVCDGEAVVLTATGDADIYLWDNDVANGEEFFPIETATYVVTALDTITGCQSTVEVTITVNALPIVDVPEDFEVCYGDEVMLIATGNANTYEWDNDVVNAEAFIATQTVTYTVTATNTATGCQTIEQVTISVNPLPTIDIPEDFAICFGDGVTLTATGDADLYEWDNNVINGEEFVPSSTETYSIVGTIVATGCKDSDEVTVIVNPSPEIILAADTVYLTMQDEHLFDAGEGFSSYLWFDESTEQTYLFVASEWGVGIHEIWAQVTNEFTCASRDSAAINVGATGVSVVLPWEINLYPNPSDGEINLRVAGFTSNKVNVRIVNTAGQTSFQKDFYTTNGGVQEVINLSNKAKGVYIVAISDGVYTITRRVVIE